MARLEQQFRETNSRAAAPSRAKCERLGEQRARLLADNIELDQMAALLAEEIAALESQVNEMARRDAAMREALRAGEEELKTLRVAVDELREQPLPDRSRSGSQAGRVEVPRRDQPQGTELPVAETRRRGRARFRMPTPSPRPSSSCNEVRARIEALGRRQRRRRWRSTKRPSSARSSSACSVRT